MNEITDYLNKNAGCFGLKYLRSFYTNRIIDAQFRRLALYEIFILDGVKNMITQMSHDEGADASGEDEDNDEEITKHNVFGPMSAPRSQRDEDDPPLSLSFQSDPQDIINHYSDDTRFPDNESENEFHKT